MLEHDLVAALAMDLVGNDVQVEEFDFLVGELVLFAQRRGLFAVDRRHLRLQPHHQPGDRDDGILAHGHRIAPALQAARGGRHVVGVLHPRTGGTAGLRETDQQVGMAVTADFFLIHVGQQEILGFLVAVRGARVDVAQVVRKRADVVVMVFRPARQMGARQLAAGPGHRERGLVGALALDGVFQGGAKLVAVHQCGHAVLL